MKDNLCKKCNRGGKREFSGRKKTCDKKIPFTRRINEKILNMLKSYAKKYNLSQTECLESAILLQFNRDLKGGKSMKIAIPSSNGKLCAHFGHCENFTFVEVNMETKEIVSIETKIPDEGISCQSANWISEQGANIVLAGGMGARPLDIFERNGIRVVAGCPEIGIEDIVRSYIDNTLIQGENSCGGEHHHCQHHTHGHCHHSN